MITLTQRHTIAGWMLALSFVCAPLADANEMVPLISVNLRARIQPLLIGVYDYTDYNPLDGPEKDIEALQTLFKEDLGVEEISPPVMNPGNKEALTAALESFVNRYGNDPDNRLVIYFSGHGETWPKNGEGREGYLLPAKTPHPARRPEAFKDTALPMSYFRDLAARTRSRHILFIFDSCFSGAMFKHRGGAGEPRLISALLGMPTRFVITAGTADQKVTDTGLFRRQLVNGLKGAADFDHDGYITGSELGQHLRTSVTEESNGNQTPVFGRLMENEYGMGDFVFYSPIGGARADMEIGAPLPPRPRLGLRLLDGGRHLFQDACPQCPPMVWLPPGEFRMGSPTDDGERQPGERDSGLKENLLKIETPFAVSQTETTFAQWDACFREGGCDRWPADHGWGRGEEQPVVEVNVHDAQQFTQWLSDKTGATYRLLRDEEWEYAARSGTATARYWGEGIGRGQAVCRGCGTPWDGERPAPVRQFSANRFHLYDMLGNVWEWVSDCALQQKTCDRGVLRGGSFITTSKGVRSATRGEYPADKAHRAIGFRVARELLEAEIAELTRRP